MNNYLYILFFVLILNLFLKSEFIGKKLGVLSKPDSIRKLHKKKIPQVGGIIFFIILIFSLIIDFNSIFFSFKDLLPNLVVNKIFFLFSFTLLFLIGFIDDRRDLKPQTKIFLFIIVSFILFNSILLNDKIYLRFSFSKNIDLFNFNKLIFIFSFVFMLNIFNMFDGLNLQSSITFMILTAYIAFYLGFEPLIVIIIMFLLLFSYFNYKNIAFLGDSGVYLLTFIIFLFLFRIYKIESLNVVIDEFIILLILPIFDFFRVVTFRLKDMKSPLLADRRHFHFLILDKFSYNMTIIIILIGYLLPFVVYKFFNLGFFVSLTIFILYYFFFLKYKTLKIK